MASSPVRPTNTLSLAGPWLSPRSRSLQALMSKQKRSGGASNPPKDHQVPPAHASAADHGAPSAPPTRSPTLGIAPGLGGGITSGLVADMLPEVVFLVLEHLDCEGLRKLSAVCKALRSRSYHQLALAEFTPLSVTLTGQFQTFHLDALRSGRRRGLNGRTSLHAVIADVESRSDVASDVAYLDKFSHTHGAADCGGSGVRLPGESFKLLKSSLSDREHRVVNLEGGLKKRVVCTFSASSHHAAGRGRSARCSACRRYACVTCCDVVECSQCDQSFCPPCRPTRPCSACARVLCEGCWDEGGGGGGCMACPRFKDLCATCVDKPHCGACGEHCGDMATCESCRGVVCLGCAGESSYCNMCGEFTMW